MYKTIDIEGKPVEFLSNAATPRVYQATFHKDILREFSNLDKDELGSDEALEAAEMIKRLAFIMNIQATKPFREYYGKLTDADYVEWLSQYEDDTLFDKDLLLQIVGVWKKNAKTSIEPKNQASPQSES